MRDGRPASPCTWDTGPARNPAHEDQTGKTWLLAELQIPFLDEFRPPLRVCLDYSGEIVGRARAYFKTDAFEFRDDVGLGERTASVCIDLGDDRRRCAGPRKEASPCAHNVPRDAGLGYRGNLRKLLGTLCRRNGDEVHFCRFGGPYRVIRV